MRPPSFSAFKPKFETVAGFVCDPVLRKVGGPMRAEFPSHSYKNLALNGERLPPSRLKQINLCRARVNFFEKRSLACMQG